MRSALNKVDGIVEIKTSPADNSCSFQAPADLDVKATLDQIVEGGNRHIKGWSIDKE